MFGTRQQVRSHCRTKHLTRKHSFSETFTSRALFELLWRPKLHIRASHKALTGTFKVTCCSCRNSTSSIPVCHQGKLGTPACDQCQQPTSYQCTWHTSAPGGRSVRRQEQAWMQHPYHSARRAIQYLSRTGLLYPGPRGLQHVAGKLAKRVGAHVELGSRTV